METISFREYLRQCDLNEIIKDHVNVVWPQGFGK